MFTQSSDVPTATDETGDETGLQDQVEIETTKVSGPFFVAGAVGVPQRQRLPQP
jgi:hypothetical protein